MATVNVTLEISTRLAMPIARVVFATTRYVLGAERAQALAMRTAMRLTRWRIGNGPWRRGLPTEAG